MKRNVIETVLGAVVLIVAGLFLVFSYSTANVGAVDGYQLKARFTSTGGLGIGDDVVISGVKVGAIDKIDLDKETYLAEVYMDIDPRYQLPSDTAAFITSESLLGGRYMQLEPGAAEDIIPAGGVIQYTQAPQNIEQLLGQFIFSMQDGKEKNDGSASAAPSAAPATVTEDLPAHP